MHNGTRKRLSAKARARRAACLPEVTRMQLEGVPLRKIAAKFEVNASTIKRWTDELQAEQFAEAKANNDAYAGKLLARYEHIYAEAMRAWHLSEEEKVKTSMEVKTLPGEATAFLNAKEQVLSKTKTRRKEKRDPSAQFLDAAMRALQGIRDIRGLDSPKRTELTGKEGGPIEFVDMTDEELLAIIAEEQKRNAIDVDSQPPQLE